MMLNDGHTCWRQIHPSHLTQEFVKLETFIPKSEEQRQLSVGHSSKIKAVDCYVDYTSSLNLKSAGVAQFTVDAISEANSALEVLAGLWDDSRLPGRPAWHCYVDFAPIPTRPLRKLFAQHLWLRAKEAGWAHRC